MENNIVKINKKPRYYDMDISVFDCDCGGEMYVATKDFSIPIIYYNYCPNCGKKIEWIDDKL